MSNIPRENLGDDDYDDEYPCDNCSDKDHCDEWDAIYCCTLCHYYGIEGCDNCDPSDI